MKNRKAYYVQKPDGELVKEGDCAIPYHHIDDARRVARAVMGIIGYWDWINGRFIPRQRA